MWVAQNSVGVLNATHPASAAVLIRISLQHAALCCCFSLQVLKVADVGDGQLSIMYTATQPTAPPQAAANGDVPHIGGPPLPAMLLVNALVLAAGGFAANKQMLQVRVADVFVCGTRFTCWSPLDGSGWQVTRRIAPSVWLLDLQEQPW
jgi:hypothetical protein